MDEIADDADEDVVAGGAAPPPAPREVSGAGRSRVDLERRRRTW
jgi:hypothetical protein